ncbi:hypothetical protein [Mesobacillus zeae]|uniref:VOC domain-containing protein n=1 Tax=Mesobacillus zeae TaxID=1917180 RepID=A0A398B1Q4_9BACI|nr:hypothetical protein [Mesobacillus zeae]RID83591.1 hypothetical protein D1970_15580 [Mesobacillus zeae]
MLFHYHFWTPYVEETERFYRENGFRVSLRVGRHEGEFKEFNPPLTWDDFHDQNILFRIIEVRKGAVNITFGYGKKITFDHVGFLVTEDRLKEICSRAETMEWGINFGERRTFINTPYGFKIELQTHGDVIDSIQSDETMANLKIATKKDGLARDLALLFNHPVGEVIAVPGGDTMIEEAVIKSFLSPGSSDPNGVKIFSS